MQVDVANDKGLEASPGFCQERFARESNVRVNVNFDAGVNLTSTSQVLFTACGRH